jgi:hypothetical protein
MALDNPARLEARPYTAGQLCDLLTEATAPKARFRADASVKDQELALPPGQMPVWDVLELLYLEKGWRVDEQRDTFVLAPTRPPKADEEAPPGSEPRP